MTDQFALRSPQVELPPAAALAMNAAVGRYKDRFLDRVARWEEGCLYCGEPAQVRPLPRSAGLVQLPLCDKHMRWAMAARRERFGKQSYLLRGYVLAWCRLKGCDREAALTWLNGSI